MKLLKTGLVVWLVASMVFLFSANPLSANAAVQSLDVNNVEVFACTYIPCWGSDGLL